MQFLTPPNALLALADGSLFWGWSVGYAGETLGEVVFNTSLTGYQEILTDPSYAEQIVTLTYPHIGNVGVNCEDEEASKIWSKGLIVKDVPRRISNWRANMNLSEYLNKHQIVAIAGIDTRKLTRHLRDLGAQAGAIVTGEHIDADAAVAKAQSFAGLKGLDLAQVVTVDAAYEWKEGSWDLNSAGFKKPENLPYHVVAFDYGIKKNILRLLVDQGCRVSVVPAKTTAAEVMAMAPDGVFLSNGPGDPEPCDYAINAIQTLLKETQIPIFGICLGHQLLALASGAKTLKMKFGHHGGNHPVQDLVNGKVMITAQNHGFAVAAESLPANVKATHKSLFDGTLQGIELTNRSAFSFQGHPEASPGPHDVAHLFAQFADNIRQYQAKK